MSDTKFINQQPDGFFTYRDEGRVDKLTQSTRRSLVDIRKRPNPPRGLRTQLEGIRWDAPAPPNDNVTHYRVYANIESNLVRSIPAYQLFLQDNLVADRVFVSAFNENSGLESAKVPVNGPIGQRRNIEDFAPSPESADVIGDGKSHLLSNFYATLADAKTKYPFVTSLNWEAAAAALQLGIDYLSAIGGGALYCKRGTYLIHDIILRQLVRIYGDGFGATIFYMPDGRNADMLTSVNFSALFATIAAHTDPAAPAPGSTPDLSMGIWGFGIELISCDGNKANNSSGHGIRIYGYNFFLRQLMIYGFSGTGLTTGWSNSADFPDWTDAMEVNIFHCKIHDNETDGWRMNGPHDSTVIGVECYQNAGKNFWLGRNGDSSFTRLHCYGAVADIGAQFDEESSLSQCVFESAAQVQLQMNAGLNGDCVVFSQPTGATYANSKGLVIGDASHTTVNNVRLKVFAFNCQKGLIDTTYAAGGGGNRLDLQGFNSSGTPLVFVNGTNTAGYAAALLLLIDYDFNLWVNGAGLGFIHMSNTSGVTQNALVVQGKDSGIELGIRFQGTSASSPTNPLFGMIRNGTSPTSWQVYSYDGTTFRNFFEADHSALRQILYQDTLIKNLKKIIYETTGAIIISDGPVPESYQIAPPGSIYLRSNGVLYVKVTGSGNTGWLAVATWDTSAFIANQPIKWDGSKFITDKIDLANSTSDITGTLAIGNGGTGATSASGARTALGVPAASTTYTKSEVDALIAIVQAQVDDHETRLTNAETEIGAQSTDIITLQNRCSSIETDISNIHTELGGMIHP